MNHVSFIHILISLRESNVYDEVEENKNHNFCEGEERLLHCIKNKDAHFFFLGTALILGPSTTMLVLTPTLHSLSRPQKERFFSRWGEEKDNCVSQRERSNSLFGYFFSQCRFGKKEKKRRESLLPTCLLELNFVVSI